MPSDRDDDQASGLTRQRRPADGRIAGATLVALAPIDLGSAAHRAPQVDPEHVAAAAACSPVSWAATPWRWLRGARAPHRGVHVA